VYVVAGTVQLHQHRLKVGADLGEDLPETFKRFGVEEAATVFGYEDQMDMHCEDAVSDVTKILALLHRPDYHATMERWQAFQFALMPNAEQRQQMSRFAGCARYVYNKALALKKERYEKKEKVSRFQLDKMLVEWKQETILDLDRAYQNFFQKRAAFPKFHKKGLRDAFRESDPKCIKLDQANSRMQLPKIGWVRYRNSREVLGAVRSVTVSQSAGQWLVSITTLREVERHILRLPPSVWIGVWPVSLPCRTAKSSTSCSR
jgi:putative transposase